MFRHRLLVALLTVRRHYLSFLLRQRLRHLGQGQFEHFIYPVNGLDLESVLDLIRHFRQLPLVVTRDEHQSKEYERMKQMLESTQSEVQNTKSIARSALMKVEELTLAQRGAEVSTIRGKE